MALSVPSPSSCAVGPVAQEGSGLFHVRHRPGLTPPLGRVVIAGWLKESLNYTHTQTDRHRGSSWARGCHTTLLAWQKSDSVVMFGSHDRRVFLSAVVVEPLGILKEVLRQSRF